MRNTRVRTRKRSAAKSLRAEIEGLEQRLGMNYMDEDVVEVGDLDDGADFMDDDIDVIDDSLLDEVEPEIIEEVIEDGCGDFMSSEVDPSGVEEQITQDYLDAVEGVAHGTELTTAPSMVKVAPTRSKYASRLMKASARLDRVAQYLEENGRTDLALRIDRIADAVDERIKSSRRV